MVRFFACVVVLASVGCSGKNGASIGRGRDVDPTGACPSGMNEDSSASAESECSGQAGLSIKDEGGNVTGKCFAKGNTVVKCNLPPECKYGFKIVSDDHNPAGLLSCDGPPAGGSSVSNTGTIGGDAAGRDINKTVVLPPPPPPPPLFSDATRTCSSYCGCIDYCNDNNDTDGCRDGCNGKKNWCRNTSGCWQDASDCDC